MSEADAPDVLAFESSLTIRDMRGCVQRVRAFIAEAAACEPRPAHWRVDMARVTAVDTAGLQLLVALRVEAAMHDAEVEWLESSAAVEDAARALNLAGELGLATAR